MLLDVQRALVTFATPAVGEPDVDFISYWVPFRPGGDRASLGVLATRFPLLG